MFRGSLVVAALVWLALAVAALWLWYYPFSADSFVYVAAAMSLIDVGELSLPFATAAATALPVPYTGWPPGYPIIIALTTTVISDIWLTARLVSLVGMVVALFLWIRATQRRAGGVASVVALAACSTTAVSAATAWSEGPFLACIIGTFLSLSAWIDSEHRRVRHLVIAAMLLGLSVQVRYAGLFLVPGYLWLIWRHGMRMERATGTMALVVALVPTAVWFARNQSLAESWRGWSMPVPALWRAPAELCQAVGDLILLGPLASPRIEAVAGAALLLTAGIIVGRRARQRALPALAFTALAFAIPLLIGPALARGLGWSGFVSARLIWPALPFAALAIFGCIQPSARSRTLLAWVAVIYLGAQTAAVVRTPQLHPRWEAVFEEFALPEMARSTAPLLANRGWVVWKTTGRPCYVLPLSYRGETELASDTLSRWARVRGVRHVVWLDEGRSQADFDRIYGPIAGTFQQPDTTRVLLEWQSADATLLRIKEGR